MTPVYSGGLVYEYSEEGNNYGLVTISGSSVTENQDFQNLMTALKNTTAPSGNGGYNANGQASTCPSQSSTWEVTSFNGEELPAIPSAAEAYMKNGAGKGPGLAGSGSQNSAGGSSATASPGSGSVTATATNSASATSAKASSTASGAAQALVAGEMGIAPFVCCAVVLVSTLFGASLL